MDMRATQPMDAIAYRFDIVLRGRRATFFRETPTGGHVMRKALGYLGQTPSQTAGPYVHIGLAPGHAGLEGPWPEFATTMVREETSGERITITGAVFDGAGAPLRDALIEIWQADANGVYPGHGDPRGAGDPFFTGFGRQAADAQTGEFCFETIRPGAVPAPGGGMMAPHVSFWIVARGINQGLHTRCISPKTITTTIRCWRGSNIAIASARLSRTSGMM